MASVSKKPWSPEEDETLLELVNIHGSAGYGTWPTIASKLGSRTGKQCRERFLNHLNPDIKHTPWTNEEDEILKSLHTKSEYGNKWRNYVDHLPGRSDNAIKNRWHVLERIENHDVASSPTITSLTNINSISEESFSNKQSKVDDQQENKLVTQCNNVNATKAMEIDTSQLEDDPELDDLVEFLTPIINEIRVEDVFLDSSLLVVDTTTDAKCVSVAPTIPIDESSKSIMEDQVSSPASLLYIDISTSTTSRSFNNEASTGTSYTATTNKYNGSLRIEEMDGFEVFPEAFDECLNISNAADLIVDHCDDTTTTNTFATNQENESSLVEPMTEPSKTGRSSKNIFQQVVRSVSGNITNIFGTRLSSSNNSSKQHHNIDHSETLMQEDFIDTPNISPCTSTKGIIGNSSSNSSGNNDEKILKRHPSSYNSSFFTTLFERYPSFTRTNSGPSNNNSNSNKNITTTYNNDNNNNNNNNNRDNNIQIDNTSINKNIIETNYEINHDHIKSNTANSHIFNPSPTTAPPNKKRFKFWS